jgi:PAS domain S-box-containing protein
VPLPHQVQVLCGTAFDALMVVDDDRRHVHVNAAAAQLLGAPAREILSRRIEHFVPSERWPELERLWASFETRGRLEGSYELLRLDGTRTLVTYRATRNVAPGCHLIAAREIADGPETDANTDAPALTAREREVLQLAADGRSSREIAKDLVLSPGTVKTHLQNVYRKLGASDRASAVALGIRRGLIR